MRTLDMMIINKNGKIYKVLHKMDCPVVSSELKICLSRVQVAVASDF